jgi:mono/diheme cytochrome c family protein
LLLLAAGCDLPGRPRKEDRPVPADRVLSFDVLYQQNCAGCHGADGRMGPGPPLNDELFRAAIPEAEVRQVITSGRPGTPMPAFARENGGPLTAAQLEVLVHQVKGIPYQVVKKGDGEATRVAVVPDSKGMVPKWGIPGPLAAGVPPYLPPEKSSPAGDRERGARAFARACGDCHGEHGQGGRYAAAVNDPAFLALISDQALRRYAITGRPDLWMPDYAGTVGRPSDYQPLTAAEVNDMVALLAHWRQHGSAGTAHAALRRHNQ